MEALTPENICSAWSATGLWPVSRVRGLGSNFILENRQSQAEISQSGVGNSFVDENGTLWSISRPLGLNFQTPRQSRELRALLHIYSSQKHSSPTQQRLFRKILKGYDEKEFDLTIS
jgi:hypothetical protein